MKEGDGGGGGGGGERRGGGGRKERRRKGPSIDLLQAAYTIQRIGSWC